MALRNTQITIIFNSWGMAEHQNEVNKALTELHDKEIISVQGQRDDGEYTTYITYQDPDDRPSKEDYASVQAELIEAQNELRELREAARKASQSKTKGNGDTKEVEEFHRLISEIRKLQQTQDDIKYQINKENSYYDVVFHDAGDGWGD